MKKFLLAFALFFSFFIIQSTALATSWVEVDPQEVKNRAEVIVLGKYDFASKPKKSKFIFQGYQFEVTAVNKGDSVPKRITVGIDGFDIGWADEFQQSGGEFLLFLEKTESADFLVPVAGPNGMIQISNGKVENRKEDAANFYENILKETTQNPSEENTKKADIEQKSYSILYLSAGILIILFISFYLFKRRK